MIVIEVVLMTLMRFILRMCRDILNSCVRNTEEAEKSSNGPNHGASGRGLGKGVWGMIEDSELAKTIRKDEVMRVRHFSHSAEYNVLTSTICTAGD
jgi:hypothetical protein